MNIKAAIVAGSPVIFVLLWSTGFIGAKLGSPSSSPFSFLLVRMIIVALLLGVVCLVMNTWRLNLKQVIHSAVAGILVHGIYLGGIFWAISEGIPAGVSAIIVGLQPLLTAIIARYTLGETINFRNWIGFLIGLFGLYLVLGPKLELTDSGINFFTISSCVIAVVGITFGTIYQKKFLPFVDLSSGTLFQYLGAIPLMALGLYVDGGYFVEWTGEFIIALTWLVFVLSIGAILLLMFLIRHGEINRVASLFYLVPIATAIESYFLFGETLTSIQILGMLVVVVAVALARRKV